MAKAVVALTLCFLFAGSIGTGANRAAANQELTHRTADWTFRIPSEIATQSDLELIAGLVQRCTTEIRTLIGHRPARESFEMRWVIDGARVSAASPTGITNHVPSSSYRVIEDAARPWFERLAAGGWCFGPHEVTHVLTSESFRLQWANEGFANFTDRLYDSAAWRFGAPLRLAFSCEETGYRDGSFVPYADLTRFTITTQAYNTASCFWLEMLQRGGFEAIRAVLARMRANPPTTTARLVTCIASAVLGTDLRPIVRRYGFGDADLAATCSYPLTITVAGGAGTVTTAPAVTTPCSATCAVNVDAGLSVTLTATAPDGGTFESWSGACTGASPTCTVAMEAARSVTASFVQRRTLSVESSQGGRVSSQPEGISCPGTCSGTFVLGTTVRLSASPENGYRFAGWSGACRGAGACTVTIGDAQAVSAKFVRQATLSIRVRGGGSVMDCEATCRFEFDDGDRLVLRAAPHRGYRLAEWGGACRGRALTCSVLVRASTLVTARFTRR